MIYEVGQHKINVEEIDKDKGIYKILFMSEEAENSDIPSEFQEELVVQMNVKDKHTRFVLRPLNEHSSQAFEGHRVENQDGFSIAHRGEVFDIEVSDPRKKSLSLLSGGGGNEIKSQMPGRILSINVEVGDCVEQGDVVLVMEAMKMENPLKAPCSGTIAALHIEPGELVDAKQVLVQFST